MAKDLQEQLAERLLTERRGHKLQTHFNEPHLDYHKHEGGIVENYEDVIKALERKHRAEMEIMVHMLQGKEGTRTRAEARKMTRGRTKVAVNKKTLPAVVIACRWVCLYNCVST